MKMNKRIFCLVLFFIYLATVRCSPPLYKTYKGPDLPLDRVCILYVPREYKLWSINSITSKKIFITSKSSSPLFRTGNKDVFLELPSSDYWITVSYYKKDKPIRISSTKVLTIIEKSEGRYSIKFRAYGGSIYRISGERVKDITHEKGGQEKFHKLKSKRR
jgi:hypothetical protein